MQELTRQLSDGNIETRRQAVEAIRGKKDGAYIPLVLQALCDVSWRVRKTALEILFDEYQLDEYIQGLIQLLYIDDNAGARNSAIEALIKLGRKATPFLLEAFNTPNKDVRKFIIDVLGEQMDARSLPLMLEAIKDEDENVRATAVEHLGKAGEISVVDALIAILDSGDLWTAYPAASALGRIGNKKAIPHLLSALSRKPLREPVLKALGKFSDPTTLGHIIPLLEDASKNIQEHALRTIEKFYHHGVAPEFITGKIKEILGDRALGLLINHAWSNKREVRISAILLLGLMKDEAAYGPLLDISHEEEFAEDVQKALVFIGTGNPESLLKLFDTDNSHQRRFICEVAGKIASPVYYDVLDGMLSDEDGHVRSIAAIGISRLNNPRVLDKLRKLLADQYEDVQEAAVTALTNLAEHLKTDELISMLKSQNQSIRKNAALLLGNMHAEESVADLGFALKDESIKVRKAVVKALAGVGSEEAVRYLGYALTDENPDIRISAALSLGTIGGEGMLESLAILTSDPDDSVRVAAAKSLGMLANKEAVNILIRLLDDRSGFVVTTAMKALGLIGGSEARGALLGMLSSVDTEVRRTAITALSSFQDVADSLIPFLKDPDWASRIAAVRVLAGVLTGPVRAELENLLDTEEDQTVIKAVEEVLNV